MLVDATCAPADIRYPTDLSLLNESREKLEKTIDILHHINKGTKKKCRTYRNRARREYLGIAKKRRPSKKAIFKAIRKQLGYVKRDLGYIAELIKESPLALLGRKKYRDLLVITEIYRQQKWMYDKKTHSISGRIVSIDQPHVRPIVRGKTSAPVEFGAKLSIRVISGWVFLDRLSWDPYNEAHDLEDQIKRYKDHYGYYPESIHADKIYQTRNNRALCSTLGIRLTGPPLGRKKKDPEEAKECKALIRQDEKDRIPVEGKFGNGKRRYGLDRVMTKRAATSESTIGTIILVMNLEKILRYFLLLIFIEVIMGRGIKYFRLNYNNKLGSG